MKKAVSISLICCILTAQLWLRPDSVHTDDIEAQPNSQVADAADKVVEGDAVDGEPDSETGTPQDQPVNPILARAAVADKSGRLTKPLNISRVLALANHGQAVNCQRDPRGEHCERIASATRCRTAHQLAIALPTRPHAPPLA